ncbi:MAG: FHA domain-containing protein [Planctomycetes bacterium]|nr:FHA domain-containing protein [Planctomycetota bacterium]
MSRRRFSPSDSSILLAQVSQLYDQSLTSSSEICLYDDPMLADLKSRQTPRFRVYLTRLEPRVKVYADAAMEQTVAYSGDMAEVEISGGDPAAPVAEGFLYDATSVGQLMCLGVGRYPHNQLRPYVGDDVEDYYRRPDDYDPNCVCGQISRDHGLIFLSPEGRICFRDFGTKKTDGRKGSKNGTWVNGESQVRNTVIEWREGDYLGLGGRVVIQGDGKRLKEHVFKLRFEAI